MKGLEISRAFFFEWGLPFIEREFPALKEKIAVGCFGGSQALGADDHLSQDHGWGPTFGIFLDDDYEMPDKEIVDRLCAAAPDEFKGYRRRGGHDTAVGLMRTTQLFEDIFGHIPETAFDWLCCRNKLDTIESSLYFLRNGDLFFDGSGKFSELRRRFSRYPEDLRLLRMATCTYRIAHYGEYNFCGRLVERGDPIPMQIALGYFAEAVMRMYFYLDDDYSPYWKWLTFEFRKRQYSPATEKRLERLHGLKPAEQADEILAICEELKRKMIAQGVVPSDIKNPFRIPWFFMCGDPLLEKISDSRIRTMT